VGEEAVRELTCTGNGVTEVGGHSSSPPLPVLFFTAFNLPTPEESRIPISCWMNRESFEKLS